MQELQFIWIHLDQALDTPEKDPCRASREFLGEIWP